MTDLPVYIAFCTAIVELAKALFKAFNVFTDEAQREAVLRVVAVVVGIGVALAFSYDALNPDAPTLAGMVVSGALLAISADVLHVGIDVGKKLATPSAPGTKATVETTGQSGGGTASASVTAPPVAPDDTPPIPPRTPYGRS